MRIHALTTGAVKITHNWMVGQASGAGRLINALLDPRHTDWLCGSDWSPILNLPGG